ncbi:endo-1,4-beta-xylanase [Kribbella capetownensis]|uniref:endo-1,4-beta-xylanase n=1 Tax=Kribbella capetownensis TaxID=1572659 RepID=UPI001EE10DC4|nr:endo-1,4-beta-xylanase [Kribbella capetownensis]
MSRKVIIAVVLAVVAAVAVQPVAQADAAPFEVLPSDPLANFNEFKSLPTDATQQIPITGNPNFTKALEINVPNGPQSPGLDGEYEITLGVPTAATVTVGDAMVATLWARSIEPTQGATTGNAHLVFETDGSPFKKSLNAAMLYGSDWQKFEFPFRAAVTYTAGTTTAAHLNLWLGYGAQKFQIAGVSVQDWGQGTPAGYPQATYEGRDANAAWRAEANARIDQYRKGNLAVSVVDPTGHPISGATVSAVQQTSAFKFGAASDGARLIGDPSGGISGNDLQQYQSKASTLFNQGALGNNLKWNHWETPTERETITLPALQWMREHGIRIRGHNLVWPSWGVMPPDLVNLQNDPAALRSRINTHVTDEASALAGIVDEWDVVNEPYSEHNVQDILGPDEIASWFRLAHQADPNAELALNDYGIVENNGWEKRHRDHVYDLVQSMKSSGTPIDLVGFESHFNGMQLTSPDDLMTIVDQFAGLGVKVAVTEFDVDTDDLQLQADYTRDFMTAMFSNPNVNQISNFGIWSKNIYNPRVALYNDDWSPKPNGLVWEDLIKRQWHTSVNGQTTAAGTFGTRGFLGDYLVTVTVNGISKQVKVAMPTTTAGASVKVIADGVATTVRTDTPNPIGDGDFESGTRGWTSLGTGPGTAANAHSGHTALALEPGSGVTQNITGLTPGTSYLLSGWGRLNAGGTQCYVGVRGGATAGTPTFQYELAYADERAYTQKLAAFTPPTGTKWVQAFAWSNPNPSSAQCTLDDLAITPTDGTPPPAQGPPAIAPTLPTASVLGNGSLEYQSATTGWYCLGTCTLKNASTTPHTGSGDLSVTGREAAWAGPAQGVPVTNGGLYDSSAWVRLVSGSDTAMVSLKLTTSTGSTTIRLGSAPVTSTGWTRISAANTNVSWTGTLTKAEWWISTTTGAGNLLVDDASFAPMAKTVTDPPSGPAETAFNPVQPTAACVVRNVADSTYTAYFGYSNANNYYIPVPVGSDNSFSPGPSDRGQTVSFLPFQRPRRVAVTWDGSPLTWRLGSMTQTASSTSPACGAAASTHRR